LPALLGREHLVCVSAESNAWPHDRALFGSRADPRASTGRPPYPHELVHWVAYRMRDGARFECLLAPRTPLSRSPLVHGGLDEAALRAGASVPEFLARWRAFVGPDDVIGAWGAYGTRLAEEAGLSLGERRLDLRKVTGDVHRGRPGSLEDTVHRHTLEHRPLGMGRAGARLGMLVAISEHLLRVAAQGSVREQTSEP
jgi:hypothetical protein